MSELWCCPNPWACENHTPHIAPANCVHYASWCPDRHDATEGADQ